MNDASLETTSNTRTPAVLTATLRVLIAEDSPVIRERLADLISELPQVEIVGEASDGSSALRLFYACRPKVVILDIQMPGPNGIEVLRQIKAEAPDCVVIMLTSFESPEFRERCTQAGADYFLHKATEFEKVLVILSEMLSADRTGGIVQ